MPEQPEQATTIQRFNYAAYLETAKNSCNKDLQQVANEEIDALKKQLEDAAEVEAQMRERIEQAQNAGNDEEVQQIEQEMQGRRGNMETFKTVMRHALMVFPNFFANLG